MTNPIYDNNTVTNWMNTGISGITAEGNSVELSRDEAIAQIRTEIFGKQESDRFLDTVIEQIILDIPESIWSNSEKLRSIDLRPTFTARKDFMVETLQTVGGGRFGFAGEGSKALVDGFENTVNNYYLENAKLLFVGLNPQADQKSIDEKARQLLDSNSGLSPYAYSKSIQNNIPLSDAGTEMPSAQIPSELVSESQPTTDGEFQVNDLFYSSEEYTYQEAVRIGLADTLAELADLEKSGAISIGDAEVFDARGFIQRITGDVPSENDKSWNVREAIQYIYSLQDDSKKVKRLQDSLRMAGYFQSLQSLPQSGVLDDATRQAWDLFLVDTIRSGKTPAEQLNVSTGNFRNMLTSGAGYLAVDPASVESMARSMGEALMGRGLSGEEVNSLMENVRTWEQQAFNRAQTAPEQQKTDLEARIEQHIRKQYRNEIAMEQWDSEVSRIKKVLG